MKQFNNLIYYSKFIPLRWNDFKELFLNFSFQINL